MPRKNRKGRDRPKSRPGKIEAVELEPSTDELAADLVRRGLASVRILHRGQNRRAQS